MSESDDIEESMRRMVEETHPTSAVEHLRTVAPVLDKIPIKEVPVTKVTNDDVLRVQALRPFKEIGGVRVAEKIRITEGEWYSDDWDKIVAYAITKMYSWQYVEMMERIVRIGMTINGEEGELNPAFLKLWEKSIHMWAKEKLNK